VVKKRILAKAVTLIFPLALLAAPLSSPAETNIFGGTGLFLTHSSEVSDPGEWRLGLYGHGYEYKLPEDPEDWDIVPVLNYVPMKNTEIMFSVPYRWHDDGMRSATAFSASSTAFFPGRPLSSTGASAGARTTWGRTRARPTSA